VGGFFFLIKNELKQLWSKIPKGVKMGFSGILVLVEIKE
jgi:hypothetical protein